MNNDGFQEKIDSCFDKFKSKLRSASPMLVGAVGVGAAAIGLAALSSYDLALMAELTDFSQISSVFEFTKDVFGLVGKESLGIGYMAYKTVNIPKNIVICGDKEEGRKPEAEPVTDGFLGINKLGRAVEKKINYSEWDNKVFLGWLKGKAEEYKEVVRDTSLKDTLVLSGCALVAATVFNVVVLDNVLPPAGILEQGGAAQYYANALHQVAEIFNNNILLAVTAFTAFTGVRAKIIKSDNEKALMKEFNVSQLELGKEINPISRIIEITDSLDGLDAANKRYLRSRENLASAFRDLHLIDDGAKADKSAVLRSIRLLDGLYAESIKDLSRLVEAAQELKGLDASSYTALVSDKQADAIESFLASKDDDLELCEVAGTYGLNRENQSQKIQELLESRVVSAKNPLDAFYGSKGYEGIGARADASQKKDHGPRL